LSNDDEDHVKNDSILTLGRNIVVGSMLSTWILLL
jgi:hypothetical protein